jgi:GT2 family glycosyltransferase
MLSSLVSSLPHDLTYEVIFADDGSTDGTRKWLADLDDARFQFILNDRNYGYAITNNLAVKQAKGRYLGLLNNDLLFESGWFEPMMAAFNATSLNVGVVGNVQRRVADKSLDHAGVALMPSGKFEHMTADPAADILPEPVYAVTGACMLMLRSDFEAVGGFDEMFVNGCEDIDLCLKVRQAGKQIYVASNSQILHHVSLSRSRVSLQNEKNSRYLYSKWRKEIKLQLTKCWVDLFGQPEGGYNSYIDGTLSNSFKSKPHIAAMAVAEAALLREEARWSRDLGAAAYSADWLSHVDVSGVKDFPQLKTYLAGAEVVVSIDQIKTARNFYVCARLLEDFEPTSIGIVISINDAQTKTFRLPEGHVVNVGVIDPLIFPGSKNHLKAEFYFVDADGLAIKPAPHVMLISHFVIDDQVVKPSWSG